MHDRWLLKAIRYCGSQKELARRMGVKPEQVSYLLNSARKISLEKALLIQRATDGKIDHGHFLQRNQASVSVQWQEIAKSPSDMRHLSIRARAELGIAYEKTLERKKRMKNKAGKWENFPTVPLRREALAAEQAQFNNYRTYRDAKYVIQQGSPALIQAMDSERIAISTAAQLLRYSSSEQQHILNLSSKEIIAYARPSPKKINVLCPTAMPIWAMTLFWTIVAQKSSYFYQKETLNGQNQNG